MQTRSSSPGLGKQRAHSVALPIPTNCCNKLVPVTIPPLLGMGSPASGCRPSSAGRCAFRKTVSGVTWQNGHVERLIGSIRRECVDHLVVFDEAQLRRMLKAYAVY